MAGAYSLDLRKRVVKAFLADGSCRTVAARFGVSPSNVVKWAQRQRTTGSAAASKMGGHRPYALAGERAWLLARLADKPDITLRALLAELAERGIEVSYYVVWHFFEHEGISFKKACTPASRIGPTWQGGAPNGSATRESLIQPAWSSSTRHGPRPT
jgi:transposase